MATHSNTLAWKIPWTEEPGRQQSIGLQRVGKTEQLVNVNVNVNVNGYPLVTSRGYTLSSTSPQGSPSLSPALGSSLVAQMVKRLPTMRVQSLDREDLLEKEMATHSSILAWKIPWTEEPV